MRDGISILATELEALRQLRLAVARALDECDALGEPTGRTWDELTDAYRKAAGE